MEIPDTLRSLFTAQVEQRDGSYVIEVPDREVQLGEIAQHETYRIAVLPSPSNDEETATETETETKTETQPSRDRASQRPPVEEGEIRRVEIEDLGEQGDGITRVERGYVVIVPDTDQGERVAVEISDVRENVAFAEVTERLSYYD
ncbi:TRAM domain-containing protein [Halorientalis brevis]|uniref:TRAM domain-containing protein n=1 Tax=Halorientalis brevis TaxID=1126241 RepID=A0ABD6CDR1_9EURY|nr:TRAM domain-containing protein [Halorientalis brevis]